MSAADRKITARETLGAVVLFAGGFAAMAALTHVFILAEVHDPIRLHADARSEKLEEMRRWHGQAFSAAFGSSHVINGIDPRTFDALTAGTPLATHTANLAIEGGSQSEQMAMADQFVAQLEPPAAVGAPPEPCFVTLELEAGTNFTTDHLVHPRAINIYDLETTRVVSEMTTPAMPPARRLGRVAWAWAALGEHYLNIGMLSNLIFSPPLNQKTLDDETSSDRRGMLPAGTADARSNYVMGQILAGRLAAPPVLDQPLLPGNASLIERIKAHSAVRHLSFVYVVMPALSDVSQTPRYPDHMTVNGDDVPIINLAAPAEYPDLYNIALWRDGAHVNEAGAHVLTTHFAHALARWYTVHAASPHACG